MTGTRTDPDSGTPPDPPGDTTSHAPVGRVWPTALWLVLLAAFQALGLVLVYRAFVLTPTGQWLESASLAGNVTGYRRIEGTVSLVLDLISIAVIAGAIAVVGFIAIIRRRLLLALVAIIMVAGSNLTTQLLKHQVLGRPSFLDEFARPDHPSLPSGHTTVAMSIAVGLVLVLPPRTRALIAVPGAAYGALVGVATLSAGWHRASDVVAAYLVVGIWAALCGLALLAYRRRRQAAGPAPWSVTTALVFCGLLLVGFGMAALFWLYEDAGGSVLELGQRPLFVAYAGAAAGITGVAASVMGGTLGGLHGVLPGKQQPRR